MFRSVLLVLACALSAGSVLAQVTVSEPWVRASLPHQTATGAFMKLHAGAEPIRLVGAASPVAQVSEVHEMKLVDNIARMSRVDGVEVPAGEMVELRPGSYHIMLLDLKRPVKVGEEVAIELVVERAGRQERIPLTAVVRPLGAAAGMSGQH